MKRRRNLEEIKLRVTGQNIEEVINDCLENAILLNNISKPSEDTILFHTPQSNLNQIEEAARDKHCEVEILEESSYEKYYGYIKKRVGFFLGLALFMLIIITLSQMIWKIEIEGADPPLEYEMESYLDELGIKVGAFQFLLPDSEMMQSQLLDRLDEVTWIGVNKKGTTYHFEVVEQTLPDERETNPPRHVVAKKTAVIESIYAEKGQPMVEQNDLVHKDDVLISGFIGEGEYAKAVAAQGEVLGEAWYKVTVEMPEKLLMQTLTGNSESRYTLNLFGTTIPIWGLDAGEEFEHAVVHEKTYDANLWSWKIPTSINVEKYQESKTINNASKKNIVEKTKEAANYQLKKHLSKDADIKAEKILHENSQNGKVKLVVHYQVIEDIKSEEPIIQGE